MKFRAYDFLAKFNSTDSTERNFVSLRSEYSHLHICIENIRSRRRLGYNFYEISTKKKMTLSVCIYIYFFFFCEIHFSKNFSLRILEENLESLNVPIHKKRDHYYNIVTKSLLNKPAVSVVIISARTRRNKGQIRNKKGSGEKREIHLTRTSRKRANAIPPASKIVKLLPLFFLFPRLTVGSSIRRK